MNRDVFLSVLAMDAHNRGYDQGISVLPVVANVTKLGNATITTDSVIKLGTPASAVGFYALAYDWSGETVISYRGTDFNSGKSIVNDVYNGWSSFTGIGSNSQFGLAQQFFTSVTGAKFPVESTNVSASY